MTDPAGPRFVTVIGTLAALLFVAFVFGAASATAAYIHPEATYEFGTDGTPGTSFSGASSLAFNQANQRLYVLDQEGSPRRVHGFHFNSPGSFSSLGGLFPFEVASGGGDPNIAVDNSAGGSANNIYYSQDGDSIFGFNSTGTALPAFSPEGGEKCGTAVDSAGHLWVGNYSGRSVEEFSPSGGAPINSISTVAHGSPCDVEIDRSNNDLFVSYYSPEFGHGIDRYTAASGYSIASDKVFSTDGNAKIAVNPVKHRLYAASGGTVHSYDTETGAEVESFGSNFTRGVTVDDATDTVFLGVGSKVQEWKGVVVPDVITGEPVGNAEVTGSVALAGGGAVTECFFEFGTEPNPESFGPTHPGCEPAAPYAADQPAIAAKLPGLVGETTYYYRIVAKNLNGTARGAVKSITPHNVNNLKTAPATEITRTTARLNMTFEGTNEDTHYYFEWAEGAGDCPCVNKTATPPGDDAGTTVGPTSRFTDISGLTAGTVYHYRVVAENSKGISIALGREFTTSPAVNGLTTDPATEVDPSSATLNGTLDPDGFATTFYFEWGKDTTYGQATPLPPGQSVGTTAPGSKAVSAKLENLERGTTYHYRIVAVNETGKTVDGDQSFTTPQPPSITSFSSTNVTADSAELIATVNPNSSASTYYFEYGFTPEYGSKVPIPDGDLPAVDAVQNIVEPISGLEERTYHFRLVATNEWGTTTTEDQTFDFNVPGGCPNTTLRQQTGAAYLPDCRGYELASAERAGGAALFAEGPTSAYASNPGRLSYAGLLNSIPGAGEPLNSSLFGGDLYIASRTDTGWVTKYVGIPGHQSVAESSAPGGEYGEVPNGGPIDKGMNRFLVWDRKQHTLLAGGPLEGTSAPYVYDNEGKLVGQLPTNVNEIPGSDTDMSEGGFKGSSRINPPMTHYAFSSIKLAFATGGQIESPGSAYDNDIAAKTVTLISKTEGGADIPLDPTAGVAEEFIRIPAISEDGSHILMSTAAPGGNVHLYMAIDDTNHFDISVDKTGTNVGVDFQYMSADGSEVYFTTDKQMTADDTDTSIDLYAWNDKSHSLTRVSDSGNLPGNTDLCSASWTSACSVEVVPIEDLDKRYDTAMAYESGEIYFYSPELLDGARGFPNKRNLYVYRDGADQYVATLEPSSPVERINVSPDGAHMAFITRTKLTAYDNTGHAEMYLYDPAGRTIKCVSCAPSGTPPTANVEGSQNGLFMSFDGRTFWATRDSLVPRDANGIVDVYEFVAGRPQLISTGTGDNEGNEFQPAGLVGVSGDGVDAFFGTYQTLVPQDENGEQLKFYDARTNGGFAFHTPAPPCEAADECHGADSSAAPPPGIGTGARLGSGGNFHPTKKKKKHCGKGKHKKGCHRKGAHRR